MAPKKKKPRAPIERLLGQAREDDWQSPSDITAAQLASAYDNLLENLEFCPSTPFVPLNTAKDPAGEDSDCVTASRATSRTPSQCSGATHADNPGCLNWMGQHLWEDQEKAFRLFSKRNGVLVNPYDQARDPGVPVGLKNLGSTCYISSYLQTWFQNRAFRNGVFKCTLASTSNVKLEDMPLFQLQVAFAAMQSGQTSVFNPSPLVKSLKIPEAEQKDATEFGKLFLGLLDTQFKKQTDPSVKALMPEMFEGRLAYKTHCKSCKHTSERPEAFLELEINIKPKCELETQLEALLAQEVLAGLNQYRCSNCDNLSDATRWIELLELPPILHFSLLRFQFDMKLMDRKKSNSFITYPKTIDMSKFVAGAHQPLVYDLKGVLLHKGTSAHHGHYVAEVWDEEKQKWFLCDDETVQVIEPKLEEAISKAKKLPKERIGPNGKAVIDLCSDSEAEPTPPDAAKTARSKDAYLLVYTRRDGKIALPDHVDIPPLVQTQLDLMAKEWELSCQDYDNKVEDLKTRFYAEQASKRKIYSVLPRKAKYDPSFLIDRDVLREIISGTLHPSQKGKKRAVQELDAVPTTRPSKSVTPDKAPETNGTTGENRHEATPDDPGSPFGQPSDTEGPTLEQEEGPALQLVDNSKILCAHKALDPMKLQQVKVISGDAVLAIHSQNYALDPLLPSSEAYCRQCLWLRYSSKSYSYSHSKHVRDFHQTVPDYNNLKKVWISKAWLEDWVKTMPKMHDEASGADPSPGAEQWRSHVFCSHGRLQPKMKDRKLISGSAAKVLQKLWPKWQTLADDQPKCHLCATSTEQLDDRATLELALQEKSALANLSREFNRLQTGPRLASQELGEELYLIPRGKFSLPKLANLNLGTEWLKTWKTWIRSPTDHDRPDHIELAPFFCEHGRLTCDMVADSEKFTVVLPEEWKVFAAAYVVDQPIKYYPGKRGTLASSFPETCEPCIAKKALDYTKAKIQIVVLTKADFDDDNKKKPYAEIDLDLGRRSKTDALTVSNGKRIDDKESSPSVRRSSRSNLGQRQSTLNFAPLERTKYRSLIEPHETVKAIKVHLYEEAKIPTIYQRLWLYDEELLDDSATMRDLGIKAGDVLQVVNARFGEDDDDVDFSRLESPRKKRKTTAENEGFGSTGLFGYDTESEGGNEMGIDPMPLASVPFESSSTEVSPTPTPAPEASLEPEKKACLACTFYNDWAMTNCEMCGSDLPDML